MDAQRSFSAFENLAVTLDDNEGQTKPCETSHNDPFGDHLVKNHTALTSISEDNSVTASRERNSTDDACVLLDKNEGHRKSTVASPTIPTADSVAGGEMVSADAPLSPRGSGEMCGQEKRLDG